MKLLFSDGDLKEQYSIYAHYISKRSQQIEKSCYCGHTIDCNCGSPSFEEFKHNVLNGNINDDDFR